MDNLFLILFFVSFVALIVGLVKPASFSRFIKGEITRKKIGKIFGIATVVFFLLFSITTDSSKNSDITQPVITEVAPVKMVFDIPLLVGRSLSELEATLGIPDYNSEPSATYVKTSDVRTWNKDWRKNGFSLSATYNIDTKKIEELFLASDSDASLVIFRDSNNILSVGNLVTNDPRYLVEFVKLKAILGKPKSETPEGYTGAIIRKK